MRNKKKTLEKYYIRGGELYVEKAMFNEGEKVQRKKHYPWTNSEERVLLDKIRNNPENLQKVFRDVARITQRTHTSVQARWYNKLKHKNAAFWITNDANNTFVNVKNKIEKSL